MNTLDRRLVIVSNRLPMVLKKKEGKWEAASGSGGLVTALAPVLRENKGLWIGWPGVTDRSAAEIDLIMARAARKDRFTYKSVPLTKRELAGYYHGFSNEILWPLFHDLQTQCNFKPDYWRAYRSANEKFAGTILRNLEAEDMIWIQDYQLMMVAQHLRENDVRHKIAFFLHIPFPHPDLFLKLPWRMEILRGLFSHDLIGFQTERDRQNFIHCVRTLLDAVDFEDAGSVQKVFINGREVQIGVFPISIDFEEFAGPAGWSQVQRRAAEIRDSLKTDCIVLGVDRLDYTKGIPERLTAFRTALEHFPELRGKMSLVQVVVPSREDLPQYQQLKEEIHRLVSEVNGRFTQPGWVPVHYMFRSLDREELLAWYQAVDIALITPIKDGMNLVAKEYCAANLQEMGVLILSEFAGAAAQMEAGALLVNPHDAEGVARVLHRAYGMDLPERRKRMHGLRREIRRSDVFLWAEAFIKALGSSDDAAEYHGLWFHCSSEGDPLCIGIR